MIDRLLRTAAEWLRNWQAERRRKPRIVTGWRLYAEAETLLDEADRLRRVGDAMFDRANLMPNLSAEQFRSTFLGYSLHCQADALHWQAGGDDEAAAECRMAAAEWRAKAAQFDAARGVENVL